MSLGAKFIELELDTEKAEGSGGYAQAMNENFYQKQREMMMRIVADSDVVITTAAIPGKKAPVLITAPMVDGMAPGSVIIDLAAERGGNCEVTVPDKAVLRGRVAILGPTNLPSEVPYHASQMFSKNVTTFLLAMTKEGQLQINHDDEVVRDTLLTEAGSIVNERVKALFVPNNGEGAQAQEVSRQ